MTDFEMVGIINDIMIYVVLAKMLFASINNANKILSDNLYTFLAFYSVLLFGFPFFWEAIYLMEIDYFMFKEEHFWRYGIIFYIPLSFVYLVNPISDKKTEV